MSEQIKLSEAKCERCNHVWVVRKLPIRTCPKCKSPYWDVPRKAKAE